MTFAIAEPLKSNRQEITLSTEPLAHDLQDFLARYGKALAGTAERKLVPLYRPGVDALPDLERIELHRSKMQGKRFQLFPSQKEKIAGAVQGMKKHSSVMFICEMGCGKTVLSLSASWVMARGKNFKVLVMCPGHLVHKWVREAQWLIPNVYARPVKLVGDLMKFRAEADKHNGPAIAVIGKEAAKLGCEMEAPIAAGKRKQVVVQIAEQGFSRKGDRNLRVNRAPNAYGQYVENGYLVDRIVDIITGCG